MKICDRCHGSKSVNGPYETGIFLANSQMVRSPCVKLINIDFCDACVVELREVIREFMRPISYIEVKQHDCKKKQPKDYIEDLVDTLPPDLV